MARTVRLGGRGQLDKPEIGRGVQHTTGSALERAVRQDRALVLLGLVVLTVLSWVYLARMAAMMNVSAADKAMHAAMGMPEMATWGAAEFVMLFLMWTVMMVAMMLPSVTPIILLVVGTYRRRGHRAHVLTVAFGSGYLAAWTAFSAVAALTQLMLHRAALLSSAMATDSAIITGGILLCAGAYQWLPLKAACLTHCRSPLAFLTSHWREGTVGALTMGLRHGLYCVGCCWVLMLLLFAAGVMNLLWVGAIAFVVLVEKLVPHGARVGRFAGVLVMVWGGWVLATGL
jgi:predicted metal-binding membrane protein